MNFSANSKALGFLGFGNFIRHPLRLSLLLAYSLVPLISCISSQGVGPFNSVIYKWPEILNFRLT